MANPGITSPSSVSVPWRRWMRRDVPLSISEGTFVAGVLAQIFLSHLLFGANRNDLALGLVAVQAALLLCSLSRPWGRAAIRRQTGLLWVAAPFAIVIGLALYTVAPLAHPRAFAYFPGLTSVTSSLDPDTTLLGVIAQGLILGRSRPRARLFINGFMIAMGLYALFAIITFQTTPTTLFGTLRTYHIDRLTGSFLSANSAGTLLAYALVLSISMLGVWSIRGRERLSGAAWLWRGVVLLCLTLFSVALVMTGSRGAFASAAVAVVIAVLLSRTVTRRRLVASPADQTRLQARSGIARLARGLGLAAVMAGVTALYSEVLAARYSASGSDLQTRLAIVHDHLPAIRAELWKGYGLGAFERVNALILTPDNFGHLWSIRALHNIYLQWIEEAGLLAASAMWLCVAAILIRLARGSLCHRPSLWATTVLVASVVPVLHGIVDYGLQNPSISGQWAVFLGLGYAAAGKAMAQSAEQSSDHPDRAHHEGPSGDADQGEHGRGPAARPFDGSADRFERTVQPVLQRAGRTGILERRLVDHGVGHGPNSGSLGRVILGRILGGGRGRANFVRFDLNRFLKRGHGFSNSQSLGEACLSLRLSPEIKSAP
jgi:O-antigen ligase